MSHILKFDTGAEIVLRDTVTKNGKNHYLAARPSTMAFVPQYGFNVPLDLVGGKLPKKAQLVIDGEAVAETKLVTGVTTSGNPKVNGSLPVSYDGVDQTISVQVSQPKDTTANVIIRSSRPRGASLVTL
jgi:hypothetical protein